MTDVDAGTLERLRGERWRARTSRTGLAVEAVRRWLPRGQMLPEHILRRRHRTIVWLLWMHVSPRRPA